MAERLAAMQPVSNPISSDMAAGSDHAPLASRVLAYLLDSLALFAFITILFVGPAGALLLLRTSDGRFSDSTMWMMVSILLATIPCWLAANLLLMSRRGCSLGQYVMGLRVLTEQGSPPAAKQVLIYWLALHPLFYHPLFGGFWVLVAFLSVALIASTPVFIGSLAVAILCFVAPLAGLLFAMADPGRRALHDRIAGLKLVRLV